MGHNPEDSMEKRERMMKRSRRAIERADSNASAVQAGSGHEETVLDSEEEPEDEYWQTLAEVNDTLRSIENSFGVDRLSRYKEAEQIPEDLGFDGFKSGLGKVVEEYVTELANQVDVSGGHFRFGEDNGAVKSGIGYTLGAKPGGDPEYSSFDEVPQEELEAVGNAISTVTESRDYDDIKSGKFLEAFRLYGDAEINQREIAERVGVQEATLSERKSRWSEAGLIDGDSYTEAGELVRDMADEIFSVK